jgi:hypothetical protein
VEAYRLKVVADANCIIDAVSQSSHSYPFLRRLFSAARSRPDLTLAISRHTIAEVKEPNDAVELAHSLAVVPYWPIGAICEQIATWEQLAGTWEDAKRNEEILQELKKLAKSGNDIRDRGAYLDALHAAADVFLTSDKHLAGSGPAQRLRSRFGLRVLRPREIVLELGL